jgi:outer membrane lipoprotein-sorting protein
VTFIRLTAAAGLLALCASPVMAQTADEIVEQHLAALGGREALSRIRTRMSTGTVTLTTAVGPVSGTIEAFAKAPNKSRMLIKLDLSALGGPAVTNDQRFDGTTGFVIDTFNGNRDIIGTQLESMKNNGFPTAFLDYRTRGHAIALIGKESLADRPTYVLEVTPKTGPKARSWVDAETYLVLKTSVTVDVPQAGALEQISEFSDFRTVDGVKIPFLVKSLNSVQTANAVLTDVKHNVEVDDAAFVRPKE